MPIYGTERAERDAWILGQRGQRFSLDPTKPYGYFVEDERASNGDIVPVATILLTNRECPWRCVMCDLWKNTLSTPIGRGAIPTQVEYALDRLPQARHIKLYNSGSFFDKGAIPVEDFADIADRLRSFERVIVESHPTLIGRSTLEFRDLLIGQLEIAIGLETAHPEVLQKLNKGMTLRQFSGAAEMLARNTIDLRTFILVQPPFLEATAALHWAKRSLDFAFENGAGVATLIPTRSGNGAMEQLQVQGLFTPPPIQTLEAAVEYGIASGRARVFADLWDMHPAKLSCSECFDQRVSRLRAMNLTQVLLPSIKCAGCGSTL